MTGKPALEAIKRSNRFRVIMNIPLRIGIKPATLVDISTTGILATHTGIMKTGSTVEISFTHNNATFHASAKIVTCTVVGLGAGEGGATLYASKMYFVNLPPPSLALLESMVSEASS